MSARRMSRAVAGWTIVTGAVAVLSGCAATPANMVDCGSSVKAPTSDGPAIVGKEYGIQMAPIPANSVMYAGRDLARKVGVQGIFASRTDTGSVLTTARLFNCTANTVHLSVRTHFMDDKLRPLEKPSAWQSVFLQPKSMNVYSESSISLDRVESYLVELRDGNE